MPDIYGVFPIEIILIENQIDNLKIVIKHTFGVLDYLDSKNNNILHIYGYSEKADDSFEMHQLILEKVDRPFEMIKQTNIDGNTPLHIFCIRGQLKLIELMINWFPETHMKEVFDIKNNKEETLLAATMHSGNTDVNINLIKLLVNREPKFLNEIDENGQTPLHKAIILQRTDIVDYLFEEHADPDLIDFDENTILHFASLHSANKKFIEILHNDPRIQFEAPNIGGV